MKIPSTAACLWLILTQFVPAAATPIADTIHIQKSVFETITGMPKKTDFLHVNLNTRFGFHGTLEGSGQEKAAFKADFLRLQITGDITDRIYYKWFQHINRSNTPNSLDNMPSSIDCLGIGFHITPALSAFIGKQYADYGGFEYDANPAEVYEFSDYGNYMTCFLVGADLIWQVTPTQELRFQIIDGRSNTAEETYSLLPPGYEPAKVPLGYSFNWNGNLFDGRLLTRWSFSFFHEGKKDNIYLLGLGTAWRQDKFSVYADVFYSAEDIDKLGILSEISALTPQGYQVTDCSYLSVISRVDYRPLSKWNFFLKGFYETSSLRKDNPGMEEGKYRTTYGYQGGVEYFPMKENLRFFLVYHGRQVDFTRRARLFTPACPQTQTLSLGIVYNIPIF